MWGIQGLCILENIYIDFKIKIHKFKNKLLKYDINKYGIKNYIDI